MAERSRINTTSEEIQSYGAIGPSTSGAASSNAPGNRMEEGRSSLKLIEKIGFGLGHVFNDLCASVWFSYTLLFMQGALQMPATHAGALVMLGQVGDAIATPIVGFLTDKHGTKRHWHIIGTLIVFLTFPMIFSVCPYCDRLPKWWEMIFFTVIILMFQFGWPIVQITHLAMIPEMSRSQKDRADLTAVRYSVSIVSSVVVYGVTWAILHVRDRDDNNIMPEDAYRFRDISLILTLIGVTMSVIFHFSLATSNYESRRFTALQHNVIKRDKAEDVETEKLLDDEPAVVLRHPKKNFFKSPLLYINALLYVFSRLFMTTSLVYMPLWLDERSWNPTSVTPSPAQVDNASVEHLATVPLVSFLASFVASVILKYSNKHVSNELTYFVGSVISISVCTWIALTTTSVSFSTGELYLIGVLFGSGSSVTMISSLCVTADMIGKHAEQGGFIYSAVTFTDKLITGITVVIIESIKCKDRSDCPEYYRGVLAYACGAAAVLGAVTLIVLKFIQTTQRHRNVS